MCDIIAVLKSSGTAVGAYSASVESAYLRKQLLTVTALGTVDEAARSISDQIYAAVDRGTPFHDQIAAERQKR